MSYYNPSFDDYIGRKMPNDDEPQYRGCWWRLLLMLAICLLLALCKN